MSSLERLLLENMMRFGPKNLTEWDQRKLKQLLKEQNPATQPTPTTDRQGTVNLAGGAPRVVDPSEWKIDGFTAPPVLTTSTKATASGSAFFDAYRTYMDFSTGLVGKTLLVFSPAGVTSIDDVQLNPANVIQRIVIQSTYVAGSKAKAVQTAMGYAATPRELKIWSAQQATRNFDLATKTVMRYDDPEGNQKPALQDTEISAIMEYGETANPTGGYVVTRRSNYVLDFDYTVKQKGVLIGYCPINVDQDSVHKTEGWGTILTTKGYPVKVEW
jgi:hypothetical protein